MSSGNQTFRQILDNTKVKMAMGKFAQCLCPILGLALIKLAVLRLKWGVPLPPSSDNPAHNTRYNKILSIVIFRYIIKLAAFLPCGTRK